MDRSYLLFPAGMILYDPPNSCPMPMLTVVGGFLPLVAWRAVEVDLAGRDRVRLKNGWMQVEGGWNVNIVFVCPQTFFGDWMKNEDWRKILSSKQFICE